MALIFRSHTIQRMFERRISKADIILCLANGEDIETYPVDTPYPSRLILGWADTRPLHLVVADNALDLETIVITVYEPDPNLWSSDFRRRL